MIAVLGSGMKATAEGYIEIPEHTETPEHTGNYRNTLYIFILYYKYK